MLTGSRHGGTAPCPCASYHEHITGEYQSDAALMLAWELFDDHTEAALDEIERLIPILVAAGFAEAEDHAWHFTPRGVARAEELEAQEPH